MESIQEIYRVGVGPSSSHTMGPRLAAQTFRERNPLADHYSVTLYGSLAATGRGHLTDKAIKSVFEPGTLKVEWEPTKILPLHPNGMRFFAYTHSGELMEEWEVYSIGGGALRDNKYIPLPADAFPLSSLGEIIAYCEERGFSLWEYVKNHEKPEVWDHLRHIWVKMQRSIDRGMNAEGVLPGGLGLARKSWSFYRKSRLASNNSQQTSLLTAYALAVSEENASGGEIVTAPTCGSCGVVPAVLKYVKDQLACSDESVVRALATAGLIGVLSKHNASISGAVVGCQGEVGVACAMAAAAAAQLMGGTPRQVEYAAEMGLEHHLGLTCDPVAGLVQIPCIERNAFGASQAISCAEYSLMTDGQHHISFDEVVSVMKETGHALPSLYRETSTGGLAAIYHRRQEAGKDQA